MAATDQLYHGIYAGVVIDPSDPNQIGRVKVFVPGVMGSLYKDWNDSDKDISFTSASSSPFSADVMKRLKTILPWSRPSTMIFGGGTGSPVNASTGTPTVGGLYNGGSSSTATPAGSGVQSPPSTTNPDPRTVGDNGINNKPGNVSAPTGLASSLFDNCDLSKLPNLQTKGDALNYMYNQILSNNDQFVVSPDTAQAYGIRTDTPENKAQDITRVLSNVIEYESGWNSYATSKEMGLEGQYSVGLFQLSAGQRSVAGPVNCTSAAQQSDLNGDNALLRQNAALNINSGLAIFAASSQKNNGNWNAVSRTFSHNLNPTYAQYNFTGDQNKSLFRSKNVDANLPGGGGTVLPYYIDQNGLAQEGNIGRGQYSSGPSGGQPSGTFSPDSTSDPRALVQRITNMGQNCYGSLNGGRFGAPVGQFSLPALGAKVWVMFEGGSPQRPVYIGQIYEPSNVGAHV
jgi:Type VI secretion system/phage-baseplate injector OB domain